MRKIIYGVFTGLLVLPALLCASDTNDVVSSGNSGTNQITTLPEITITATRISTSPENTSSSATVISAGEIARSQQPFVADVLRGEPGVDVAATGQPGSQTQVFLRGASPDGTLVLIDGIPVNNAFNNSFDFSTLPVNNISRIEILRGPQSTLYGSEALGGVINIVTKTGGGPPTGSVQTEYGSFNSLLTRGTFAAGEDKLSFSADGSFHSTDNDRINSAYQGINFSGHLSYDFSDRFKASLLTTYLKSSDGSPNDIFTDDPNDSLKNENYLVGLTLEADPVDWWNSKLTVSHSHERGLFDEPAPNPPYFFSDYSSRTIAERNRVDFQNIFTLNEQNKILGGGTFENDSANYQDTTPSALARTIDTESAYAEYDFSPIKRVMLTAGGRVDTSSAFGSHATYQFGGRFTAPKTETIFRANVGTGFRAPSIDDLYYPNFGNPNLKPEESFGWDVGFEQPLLDGKLSFGTTFFHNDYDNLIQYSGVTFEPENIGRARTLGLENFVSWMPLTNLTIRAAYTWLDSKDLDTGSELVRRPQNSGSLYLDWKICPRLDATAHALFTGDRTDNNYDNPDPNVPPIVTLSEYTKVDMGLNCRVSKNFSIYGRVENLLDEHYQEAYGFPALGRFFAAGVIARF